MAQQTEALHTDTNGKRTSAVWGSDGTGVNRWVLWVRNAILERMEKAVDAAYTAGDRGLMALALRRDTAAASSGASGDYEPLQTDALGRLRVTGPVLEDAAAGDGDAGFPALAVRRDTAAADAGASGDYSRLAVDALGYLRTTRRITPDGATRITGASGNVANSSAVATLAAGGASVTTYITGFEVTAAGATAATVVNVTVANTVTGSLVYVFSVTADPLVAGAPLIVEFPEPIPANAANTAITVTLPALGAGNTHAAVVAHGFQR